MSPSFSFYPLFCSAPSITPLLPLTAPSSLGSLFSHLTPSLLSLDLFSVSFRQTTPGICTGLSSPSMLTCDMLEASVHLQLLAPMGRISKVTLDQIRTWEHSSLLADG